MTATAQNSLINFGKHLSCAASFIEAFPKQSAGLASGALRERGTAQEAVIRILIRFFTDLGKAHPEPRADNAAAAYVAQQHKEGTA